MNLRDLVIVVLGVAVAVGVLLFIGLNGSRETSKPVYNPTPEATSQPAQDPDTPQSDVRAFHDHLMQAIIARSPEWTSSLRLFGDAPDPTGNLLDDISPARLEADIDTAETELKQLRALDFASQSDDQQLTTEILDWFLDDIVRGKPFAFHAYQVHQLFSVPNQLFELMLDTHQVHTRLDAENYVARLDAVAQKFDQLIEILTYQEAHGILAPKFILERVLQGLGTSPDPKQHIFYTAFIGKLAAVPALSQPDQAAFAEAAAQAIERHVLPAFGKLRGVIEHQVTLATDDAGVWHLPDGDRYYAYMLRHHTTTDLTPEAVHQIGLSEVDRIQGQMREVLGRMGFNAQEPVFGDLMQAYFGQTRGDPNLTYPDTPEGHQQAVDGYTAIIREVEENLGDLFDALPKVPVQVRAMPPEKQGSPAHYVQPSLDGSRPGTFFANASPPPFKPGMRTLTFHEAIPGHHLHLALQQEADLSLAQKVLIFTAHVEGWALYAEKLMREHGFYPDDYSKVENLLSELFRALRLVIDTGIHYKRWTREQAVQYAQANYGGGLQNEIDRYIVWPGQATAYKIGELKILELRQRAMDELGPAFDIKAFHNVMLLNGQMPLNVLDAQVNRYIAREKAKLN